MKEKAIDTSVERWRKQYLPRVISIKLSTLGMYGAAGWPDRMFLGNVGGKPSTLFIEWKAEGRLSGVTEIQEARHSALRALGFTVKVFDTAGEGKAYLAGWFT
jgi:hypothetical protein